MCRPSDRYAMGVMRRDDRVVWLVYLRISEKNPLIIARIMSIFRCFD